MFNAIERLALRFISIIVLIGATIFSIYIHIFGKISPGGGFQAGALLSSAIIVHQVFNNTKILHQSTLIAITIIGVMLYIGTGFASLLFSGVLFQFNVFHHIYGHIIGEVLVETGVFLVVSSSMIRIANILHDF